MRTGCIWVLDFIVVMGVLGGRLALKTEIKVLYSLWDCHESSSNP